MINQDFIDGVFCSTEEAWFKVLDALVHRDERFSDSEYLQWLAKLELRLDDLLNVLDEGQDILNLTK